jgi:hypothetical protein
MRSIAIKHLINNQSSTKTDCSLASWLGVTYNIDDNPYLKWISATIIVQYFEDQ